MRQVKIWLDGNISLTRSRIERISCVGAGQKVLYVSKSFAQLQPRGCRQAVRPSYYAGSATAAGAALPRIRSEPFSAITMVAE